MEHQDAPNPSEPSSTSGSTGVPLAAASRISGLVFGVAAAVVGAMAEGLERLGTEQPVSPAGESVEPADLVDQVGHAAIGAGTALAGRALAVASWAASGFGRAAAAFLSQPMVRGPVDQLTAATGAWEERGRETLDVEGQAAIDAGLDLAAEIARRVIERLDLNAIIADVDLDQVVARLDVNEIAARLDVDRMVRRLDLTGITQGVIDQLDLTAIARRVIDELDLTEIARRVIDELELTELIRESTATVSVDTVDAIRVGGMTADRALARLVDRLLRRSIGSDTNGNGRPADPAAP